MWITLYEDRILGISGNNNANILVNKFDLCT